MSIENRKRQYELQLERELAGGVPVDPALVKEFAPKNIVPNKKGTKK